MRESHNKRHVSTQNCSCVETSGENGIEAKGTQAIICIKRKQRESFLELTVEVQELSDNGGKLKH